MDHFYFHKKFPNSGQIVATVLATSETLSILVQHSEFQADGFSTVHPVATETDNSKYSKHQQLIQRC